MSISENKQHTSDAKAPRSPQAEAKAELKNQNPNQHHNTKKVSLGPNTKR